MRMHYYHYSEAGNKGAYRKPQKNTAEGPEKTSMGAHRCSCVSVHISRLHWSPPEVGGGSHCSSLTAYIQHQKAQCRQAKYESTHFMAPVMPMFWVFLCKATITEPETQASPCSLVCMNYNNVSSFHTISQNHRTAEVGK